MDHFDIIRLLTVVLAFVGYFACLARFGLITLLASAGFGAYLAQYYPVQGPNLTYWVVAVLFVLVLAIGARLGRRPAVVAASPPMAPRVKAAAQDLNEIVIDGTNVMYWDGEAADLSTLRVVVDDLSRRGYAPVVFLDASSRHHLKDKSLNENSFAKALGLPQTQVMVCPAKTEADAFILKFAREQGLPVVSNDRFGDRHEQTKGLKLVKGVIARGKPIFEGL
jgi:Zc3h12a-like Ribonuclease NYN domain